MGAQASYPTEEQYRKCNDQLLKAVSRWRSQEAQTQEQERAKFHLLETSWDDRGHVSPVVKTSPAHVLVVDDHDCIYECVHWLLKGNEHFVLSYAKTIEEMWLELGSENIDIILLDIHFPEGDSLGEIPKIRRLRPETKIVPLTIEKDPDYIATHSLIGVDGWMPKGTEFPKIFHSVLNRVMEDTTGPSSCVLCLPTHIPEIDIVFDAGTQSFSLKEKHYLGQIVETMHFLPSRETRYRAANSLGISETYLKNFLTDSELPSFANIQKALCAAVAAAVQWMDPELSLEQVAERISAYSGRGLNRLVRRVFRVTLSQIRKLKDLRSLTTDSPFPISFVLPHSRESEVERVLIRTLVRNHHIARN